MATSKKIIDIANSLDFVNDYNNIGITGNNARISTSEFGELLLYSTSPSVNGSTGTIVLYNGGLSINSTLNSTSITSGGAMTIMGGVSIFKDVLIGGNLDANGSGQFTNIISTNITTTNLLGTSITTTNINVTGNIYQNGSLYVSSSWNQYTNGNLIYTTGNVGIATTSPEYSFDVNGTGRLTNVISTNSTTNTLNAIDITTGNINFTGNLYQNGEIYTSHTSQWTTFSNGNLGFSSGNVGINTSTPIYSLDVRGDFSVRNDTLGFVIGNFTSQNVVEIQNSSSVGNSAIQFIDYYLGNTKLFVGYSNPYNSSVLAGSSYVMSDTATSLKLIAGNKTSIPVILNASDNSVSITTSTDSTDVYSGSLKVSGGVGVEKSIHFGNYIVSNSILLASPTETVNGGNGSRFVISPGVLNTATPYAIGIENGNLWNSSPYGGYKWYTNTNASMQLTSGNLTVIGDVTAFGNISDKRLKNTITPINIQNALDIVNKLEPVTFTWKDSIANVSKRGTKDVGFIAQEVENLIPYAVSEFTDINTHEIFKNIKHERIIPYLVAAIQKLSKQIKDLQK